MKKLILLIDDDEEELEFFIDALHQIYFPCDCIFARSAEQALKLLCCTVPDFIFVDFNMPKMNGLRCLEEIKKINNLQSVPVILYSSAINDELTENAMVRGAAACIKKPYKVSMLAEILQHIFSTCTELKVFFATTSKNN